MSLPVRARRRRAARHFLLPLHLVLSACCLLLLLHLLPQASAFARFTPGNVLLLDHLNLNHEKGRHDLVRAFYFEVLGLSSDPRKAENMDRGRKTLWANAGITQFHLPEADRPQVFDGLITLAYPSEERLQRAVAALLDPPAVLAGTSFEWTQEGEEGGAVLVTDPWGTRFRLVVDAGAADVRGSQPGAESLPVAMSDLCVHVPRGASLPGIARFYRHVLGAPATTTTDDAHGGGDTVVSVVVSPQQTLTFRHAPIATSGPAATPHEDLERDEQGHAIVANHGPHVSVYVRDLAASYRRAAELGATFVNTRFKRKAYSLSEALDQAMFRCLDIVDPSNRAAGPILRLEHEVRSMTNADGSKYKSCPFDTVPPPAV